MDLSTMNIWCWLIPLIVGVLCAYFGYLLGKGKGTPQVPSNDLKSLQDENASLKAELDACQEKLSSTSSAPTTRSASKPTSLAATPVGKVFDANAAKAAMGKAIKQDDLTVIEGIGPKISGMFIAKGIKTWQALSDTTVAQCKEVLDEGGNRYKIHDPASWPMQAKMAYEGKWKDLSKWQIKHKHGKL